MLATGLTTIIGVQAFIIIGGVIRVVPLTGITLPFVSYGGSSLLANYMLLALLMRISDSTARRLGEVPDTPTIGERLAARRAARRERRAGAGAGAGGDHVNTPDPAPRPRVCWSATWSCSCSSTCCRSAANASCNANAAEHPTDGPRLQPAAGPIVTADGVVAAESVPTPADSRFEYQRQYPTGDLFANITGYYTFAFGTRSSSAPRTTCSPGNTDEQQLRGLLDMFSDSDTSGDVVTDRSMPDLQQVAKDALGDREGSVVVMDPATGAVLAMCSYPSYDPNLIAVHDADAGPAPRSSSATPTPASRCSPTRTRSATCRARRSR